MLYDTEINHKIDESMKVINTPIGQSINMSHAWGSIKNIEEAIESVKDRSLRSKLTISLQNAKDAMKEVESAISSIAIK